MTQLKSHPLRNLIITLITFFLFFWGVLSLINSPATLKKIIPLINERITVEIGLERFKWTPVLNKIRLTNFSLKTKNGEIIFPEVNLSYSLLGLLSGKIVISELEINSPDIHLKKGEKKDKKRGELSRMHLFFLKQLVIEEGEVTSPKIEIDG
ncbi:MAG: hypothetical protein ABIE74_06440, partial [Pseudomonadota bacterium]